MILDEITKAIQVKREACALLLENFAQERRKAAHYAPPQRRLYFLETADLVDRLAMQIRERESILEG